MPRDHDNEMPDRGEIPDVGARRVRDEVRLMSRREAAALRGAAASETGSRGDYVARRARSHSDERARGEGLSRTALLGAALFYTVFVVYGSLVPLEYRAIPLDEALRRFQGIPWLTLGIGSRADWVANLLLFVPLAFLWLGVLWHRQSLVLRLLATLLVFLGATLLSVGIEFTQLFFPPRTVSQNDLLAEAIGAVCGVLAWWTAGPRLAQWAGDWLGGQGDWSLAKRLLYVYLAGLFAYNLLPLDLTISPVEVFHKLQEGRVVLIPFSGLPAEPVQAVYELLTDVAIWVPVGLLWCMSGGSRLRGWRNALLAALLLEFLQLWVFSRVSDVTDLFTAALGAWVGVALGARVAAPASALGPAGSSNAGAAVSLLAALAWFGGLAVVFWYPFDFNTDGQFLRERVASLQRAPFTAYYYGTEFRAATEVLHKVLFFLPLGFLIGSALRGFGWHRGWQQALALAFAGACAAVIEAGQLALPGKIADVTDWLLECLGAGLGAWLAFMLASKERTVAGGRSDQARRSEPKSPGGKAWSRRQQPAVGRSDAVEHTWRRWVMGTAAIAGMFWVVAHAPGVPYNVRELLAPGQTVVSTLAFAVALVLVAAFPSLSERLLRRQALIVTLWRWPLLLAGGALLCAAVLMIGVPEESVADVVGSPVLGWWWRLEQWLRLATLVGVVMWMLLGGMLPVARCRERTAHVAVWVFLSLAFLPLAYWVVVVRAATDNLTELMADNAGPLGAAAIAATILVAGAGGAWIARLARQGQLRAWGAAALVGAAAILSGYGLALVATEPLLIKYGRIFSALQFLLGADRDHPPSGIELFARFASGFGALLVFAAWAASPLMTRCTMRGKSIGND